MESQRLSPMQKMTKTTKKIQILDPCPICDKELHLNHEFTQRVGLLDSFDEVIGWLCPHCNSDFDVENHLVKFLGEGNIRGEA